MVTLAISCHFLPFMCPSFSPWVSFAVFLNSSFSGASASDLVNWMKTSHIFRLQKYEKMRKKRKLRKWKEKLSNNNIVLMLFCSDGLEILSWMTGRSKWSCRSNLLVTSHQIPMVVSTITKPSLFSSSTFHYFLLKRMAAKTKALWHQKALFSD